MEMQKWNNTNLDGAPLPGPFFGDGEMNLEKEMNSVYILGILM